MKKCVLTLERWTCSFSMEKNSYLAANHYIKRYPVREAPNCKVFTRLIKNLTSEGSFDKKRQCQPRVVTKDVNYSSLLRRLTCCAWITEEFTINPGFVNNIIWTNGTNF